MVSRLRGHSPLLLLWLAAAALPAATIRGRVVDSRSTEPLGRVEITCDGKPGKALSTPDGVFVLEADVPCVVRAVASGYRPVSVLLETPQEVEFLLVPDSLAGGAQKLTVTAGPFAGEDTTVALAGNELRNLSNALVDDPMRAVQSLPGVVGVDDFQSQFSLRSAGFSRIGVLVDGVLLHAPFHAVVSDTSSASVSNFQGEILEAANVLSGPLPSRYGDRTGGVLDMRTRDGLPTPAMRESRRLAGKINLSTVSAGGSAEGRLGRKGTWLAAARQSYLQYIIGRTSDEPGLGFSFRDAQLKLSYDVDAANRLSLLTMLGRSGLDRDASRVNLGLNTVADSSYTSATSIASWRHNSTQWVSTLRAAYLRERFGNRNRLSSPLQQGYYTEWVASGDVEKQWRPALTAEFGGWVRRMREDGRRLRIAAQTLESWHGSGTRWSGFGRLAWPAGRRFRGETGLRADGAGATRSGVVSPYATLAFHLTEGTRIYSTWSQSVQFPEVAVWTSTLGRRSLPPIRSSQAQLGVEHRFAGALRFRVEAYNRQDRDLPARPLEEPRALAAGFYPGALFARWEVSQRAYARGVQAFLQSRSANRLNGWISYAYGRSRTRDAILNTVFDSDFELRHLVQAVAAYRLRARWTLSSRFTYGSGMPVPGFFESSSDATFLSRQRNLIRLPAYQRTDLRLNRLFLVRRTQWTLFAEVLNMTNHANARFDDIRGIDARTGSVRIALQKTFPIVPAAGLVIDF